MKSYREIADSVFARRDQYIARQRKKKQTITRVTASVGSVALVSLVGIALLRSDAFHDTPPISHGDNSTTTVTNTPTEIGDTTTINNTTATTTDDGAVAPVTTVTTNVAPSQSTTGKTQPTKTTTTAIGTKDKLLITGYEPDDSLMQDESGAFMPDRISPLLKQTMEQYKDIDAVYAVLVAVNPTNNQKLVDDLSKAIDAFLESDEMLKLAEQCDLAYEAWQAIDEEREANIGNEEWAAEFLSDWEAKRKTYRSLSSEYLKRREDFKWAYWNAYADEAVEALAELSDINLISLYERATQDQEKLDEKEIDVIVRVLSSSWFKSRNDDYGHGYAAVLSADEILALSESDNYIFWLDSCDEDTARYLIDM